MIEYHKIPTVFKRDPDNKFRTLLDGQFAEPEFGYLAGLNWIWTEKVDGTNIRIMKEKGAPVVFGGKSDNSQIPAVLVKKLMELFPDEKMNEVLPDGGCLYGEGYGANIQKGGGNYNPDGVDFILFDVKIGDWWLKRDAVKDVADKLGIRTVPIIGNGPLYDMIAKVRDGFYSTWGDFKAEGIVARPEVELFTRAGKRIITKIKTKDFR